MSRTSTLFPLVCGKVIATDVDPVDLRLAERIIRAPMHPADQFEAFCAVIDQGKSVAQVAAGFNVSGELVQIPALSVQITHP